MGKNAFAHKGGMHVAGVNADPATFEHIDPAAVGNAARCWSPSSPARAR